MKTSAKHFGLAVRH